MNHLNYCFLSCLNCSKKKIEQSTVITVSSQDNVLEMRMGVRSIGETNLGDEAGKE